MASYIVDACYAYLEFKHPLFPAWSQVSNSPIHVLLGALNVHKYRNHIIPICTHFYPPIYKAINGTDMLRVSEAGRQDLNSIGAWWYFKDVAIIRVEGTLIPPIALPPYVPDRLIALEMARQCFYGVVGKCKVVSRRPYPYLPFKIGDVYLQNWPSLEKFAREIETMNLLAERVLRYWDLHGRVRRHLVYIQDKVGVAYYHQTSEDYWYYLCLESWEEVELRKGKTQASQGTMSQSHTGDDEVEETDESIKRKLLSGLPTGLLEVHRPSTTTTAMIPTPRGMFPFITLPLSLPPTPLSSLVAPSLLSRSTFISFRTFFHQTFTIALVTSSPVTIPPSIPLFPIPTSPVLSSPTTSTPILSTTPPFTSFSQSTPLTTKVVATMSLASLPLPSLSTSSSLPSTTTISKREEVPRGLELGTTLPLNLLAGINVSPFVSLKPMTTMAFAIVSSTLSQSQASIVSLISLAQAMSKQEWIHMQLDQVEKVDTSVPRHSEVTLEFDKSTSSLKRVTKRRVKIGE
eukprot:Gb_31601 [translate_table: standard]